jgi:hypothetical protein
MRSPRRQNRHRNSMYQAGTSPLLWPYTILDVGSCGGA